MTTKKQKCARSGHFFRNGKCIRCPATEARVLCNRHGHMPTKPGFRCRRCGARRKLPWE